jgi:hypothetical protein
MQIDLLVGQKNCGDAPLSGFGPQRKLKGPIGITYYQASWPNFLQDRACGLAVDAMYKGRQRDPIAFYGFNGGTHQRGADTSCEDQSWRERREQS